MWHFRGMKKEGYQTFGGRVVFSFPFHKCWTREEWAIRFPLCRLALKTRDLLQFNPYQMWGAAVGIERKQSWNHAFLSERKMEIFLFSIILVQKKSSMCLELQKETWVFITLATIAIQQSDCDPKKYPFPIGRETLEQNLSTQYCFQANFYVKCFNSIPRSVSNFRKILMYLIDFFCCFCVIGQK